MLHSAQQLLTDSVALCSEPHLLAVAVRILLQQGAAVQSRRRWHWLVAVHKLRPQLDSKCGCHSAATHVVDAKML